MSEVERALWKIYWRPERPSPWINGGNLPWDEPGFSERMLREHLDESHGAASRPNNERAAQIDWLWRKLEIHAGDHLFDVTCGPGLYAAAFARRGCRVTGIDFSPASIRYAVQLASEEGVANQISFHQLDVRQMDFAGAGFDAAILLYGQLAVFPRKEAEALLTKIAQALRPGGKLCIELLNQAQVDKTNSSWWFTDNTGLWGDAPFLHLGERMWDAVEKVSIERYQILHLESGRLDEIQLCDQTYSVAEMGAMLERAGFTAVSVLPAWDGLPLDDAREWMVYLAEKQRINPHAGADRQ